MEDSENHLYFFHLHVATVLPPSTFSELLRTALVVELVLAGESRILPPPLLWKSVLRTFSCNMTNSLEIAL